MIRIVGLVIALPFAWAIWAAVGSEAPTVLKGMSIGANSVPILLMVAIHLER